MTDVALTSLSITELSTLLSKGEVSPVEVTNAYLSLIEQLDSELNAYITLAAEPALAAARMAEETIRTGHYLGPLHGVPVAVKDLFLVNGLPRTCGASIMGDQVARRDATSVARLRAAGAIILGVVEPARVCLRADRYQPPSWHRSKPLEPDACVWRLEQRFGLCGGGIARRGHPRD